MKTCTPKWVWIVDAVSSQPSRSLCQVHDGILDTQPYAHVYRANNGGWIGVWSDGELICKPDKKDLVMQTVFNVIREDGS